MVRIRSRTSFGKAGRPRLPRRISQVQKRRNPFPCQPRGFDDGNARSPIVPDGAQPSPQESICHGEFGPLPGALKDAELMAKRDDLQLKVRSAPECTQGRRQERREYRPVWKSTQDRQLPIYQSDRNLREPQCAQFLARAAVPEPECGESAGQGCLGARPLFPCRPLMSVSDMV
jgi:hypothetical protein